MKTYLVFVIQGYEQRLDDGTLVDSCVFELIDKDAKSAIKRAKKLVKKPFYRVHQIIEKEIL